MIHIEKCTVNEIEDLILFQEKWNRLERGNEMTVYQSFQWNLLLFQEWYNSRLERYSSKIDIFFLYDEDCLKIICPLINQIYSTKTKWFGRKKGVYILGHGSYSDYLNFIYSDYISINLLDLLLQRIQEDYANKTIDLTDIPEGTFLNKYLVDKNITPVNKSAAFAVYKESSVENYNKTLSKHTRQNLRTALNRMKTDGIEYEYKVFGKTQDKSLLDELRSIHISRMKVKNTKNTDVVHTVSSFIRIWYRERREYKNNIIYSSMQQMDNSCIVVTYLNSKLVGYLYGLRENKGIRIMQNCFDEEYKFYSPLFRCAYDFILQSYDDETLEWIDFTRGNEDYKYKLAGREMKLYEYLIVNRK